MRDQAGPGFRPLALPPLTTAACATATHLVKASPRSITTAVFSPPLPRPSYSGMVVKKTFRRKTRTQIPTNFRSQGARPGLGLRRATAGSSQGRARRLRAVPGCASFGVGPRALQATRSVGLERKPCVFCCESGGGGAGHQVHRDDQARLPPKRGGGTGSFPLDTPSIGAAGGGFLCMFLLGVLSLLVRQKAET